MSAPSPLHVVFGFGPIGRAVIARLIGQGARVRLAGRGQRPGALPSPAGFVQADATDPHSATAACEGCAGPEARCYARVPRCGLNG